MISTWIIKQKVIAIYCYVLYPYFKWVVVLSVLPLFLTHLLIAVPFIQNNNCRVLTIPNGLYIIEKPTICGSSYACLSLVLLVESRWFCYFMRILFSVLLFTQRYINSISAETMLFYVLLKRWRSRNLSMRTPEEVFN